MANLTDLIDNIETTRFHVTGADDPSAHGQPYWGIDMDDATDETLRNIVNDIDLLISNTSMMDNDMERAFKKWLETPFQETTYFAAIFRLKKRLLIDKVGWTYDDIKRFNVIIYSVFQVFNATSKIQYNAPKEIIIVR